MDFPFKERAGEKEFVEEDDFGWCSLDSPEVTVPGDAPSSLSSTVVDPKTSGSSNHRIPIPNDIGHHIDCSRISLLKKNRSSSLYSDGADGAAGGEEGTTDSCYTQMTNETNDDQDVCEEEFAFKQGGFIAEVSQDLC